MRPAGRGPTVAMVGDGTDDGPATGIAIGVGGTDSSRLIRYRMFADG